MREREREGRREGGREEGREGRERMYTCKYTESTTHGRTTISFTYIYICTRAYEDKVTLTHLGCHDVMCPVDDDLIAICGVGLYVVSDVDWLPVPLVVWTSGEMRMVSLGGGRVDGEGWE